MEEVRIAEDVSTAECVRLARAMTLKNAAAGLPHGGGKAVLFGDPKMAEAQEELLIRGLAKALLCEEDYIFAPDMGTDEACMAWFWDEIGRVVALPREFAGIPLDQIGATGWGLSHAAEVPTTLGTCSLQGARIAVQEFGAVGRHAARFLAHKGAVVVAAADSRGGIYNSNGLDLDALVALKADGQSVTDLPNGTRIEGEDMVALECDIWIPAACPDVVNENNVDRLQTRMVLEGANIPVTPAAEANLHERDVLCVPDFIANAGGVICPAMEYRGATQQAAMQTIEEKIRRYTRLVLEDTLKRRIPPRWAALDLALQRVRKAMAYRRFSLFSSPPDHVPHPFSRPRRPGDQDLQPIVGYSPVPGRHGGAGCPPLRGGAKGCTDFRLRAGDAGVHCGARHHPPPGSGGGRRRHPDPGALRRRLRAQRVSGAQP